MLILGIDPGLDGACALLADDWQSLFDLPTMHDELYGRRICGPKLAQLLQERVPLGESVRVCIEALTSTGGWGRNSASTVGSQHMTQGAVMTTLELLGLGMDGQPTPQQWKKFYGLAGKAGDAPETKRRTRLLACELYPALADQLQLQAHHNRADAILLAHWFRRTKA